ncbi:hypothetical protein BSG1_20585 [Bacillus sp. SG-1]|nr:hypothetical protein BSG1_20585 [Bacillus sp. SG-1]
MHDAAFSLNKSEKMFLDYSELLGFTMKDNYTKQIHYLMTALTGATQVWLMLDVTFLTTD